MKNWFSKRCYPDEIIENEMKKVHFGVPFVVTYHLRLKVLGKIIHKNLNLSLRNEDALTPVPMVCLRIA